MERKQVKINNIEIWAFCYESEDPEKVKETINKLLPEPKSIEETIADGFFGEKIRIYKVVLDKKEEINKFFEILKKKMDKSEIEYLLATLSEKYDPMFKVLHIRFDKQVLYAKDKAVLTSLGDCIKIRVNFECPENISEEEEVDAVIEIIKKLLLENK